MRSTEAARKAGYATYSDYLRSKHWHFLRMSYRTNRPWVCICGARENLELHHLSYDNLRMEQYEDLSPLCPPCHAAIHEGGELDPYALERLIRASRYSQLRPDHSKAKAQADAERGKRRGPTKPRLVELGPAERLAAWEARNVGPVPQG